jgi:hypothetical protein
MGRCRLCRGWNVFLQSPGKWAEFSCHDEVVQMTESRLMGRNCPVIVKLSKWLPIAIGSKNHDNCAMASSPIDFVLAAGLIMVHKK